MALVVFLHCSVADEGTVGFVKKISEVPIRSYLVKIFQTILNALEFNQAIHIDGELEHGKLVNMVTDDKDY